MLDADHAAVTQDRRTLERIPELTHVPRPIVGEERLARIVRQPGRRTAERSRDVAEKRLADIQNIRATLSQRGQADIEYPQPVIQVLAEISPFDGFRQVAVRRGDDADIRLLHAHAAKTLELPLLEHAKELRLRRRAHHLALRGLS
jgi:hypothetical protein